MSGELSGMMATAGELYGEQRTIFLFLLSFHLALLLSLSANAPSQWPPPANFPSSSRRHFVCQCLSPSPPTAPCASAHYHRVLRARAAIAAVLATVELYISLSLSVLFRLPSGRWHPGTVATASKLYGEQRTTCYQRAK
jgi:hypothetical protein